MTGGAHGLFPLLPPGLLLQRDAENRGGPAADLAVASLLPGAG